MLNVPSNVQFKRFEQLVDFINKIRFCSKCLISNKDKNVRSFGFFYRLLSFMTYRLKEIVCPLHSLLIKLLNTEHVYLNLFNVNIIILFMYSTVFLFISVVVLLIVLEFGTIPQQRIGFYCNDPKISLKFMGDTISITLLFVGCLLTPIIVVCRNKII